MALSGNGFLNGPLPRQAMVKSTEGLTHAKEYFPSATAMISRKLPVVNDRDTSFFGSPALLRSDKRRRRPRRVSVCRTSSAARLVWCDKEVSYKRRGNFQQPFGALYSRVVSLDRHDLFPWDEKWLQTSRDRFDKQPDYS